MKDICKRIKKAFEDMKKNDLKFEQFARENEAKTYEDIALEYDLDYDLIKQFI